MHVSNNVEQKELITGLLDKALPLFSKIGQSHHLR